ncbi:deoxycytidylate deaminase [Spongisporangium articulatum]|uniref:Deoxycytidylate deaminase n=1 Tax=Spongisporangium articulatum TaxID=3362603 RepID=A0ABW8AGM4_9ACTN
MSQLLLFLPVLHAGYRRLLAQRPDAEILLVGPDFASEYPVVRKEIRALDAAETLEWLLKLGLVPRGRVLAPADLPSAVEPGGELIVPDEDLMRSLVADFGLDARARVVWQRTFLRWDREWSRAGVPAEWDGAVSEAEYARHMQGLAFEAAGRSSDWWRQVGAVAARGETVLAVEHNRHLPTEYSPYVDGDPRNDFRRGVELDRSTAVHAEQALIARAAREGFSLAGADLHVTTFPCPACSRLIAEVGFARCYFAGGYSVLAGAEVMRGAGVELIAVDLSSNDES